MQEYVGAGLACQRERTFNYIRTVCFHLSVRQNITNRARVEAPHLKNLALHGNMLPAER